MKKIKIFNGMKKNYLILSLAVVIIFGALLITLPTPSIQASGSNFFGYAWSDNIGWIDMNNVKYNSDSGAISGYGWSENVGWVSFNASGCPSGSCPAKLIVDGTDIGKMTGWAKILSFDNDGEATNWADGWISLSGNDYGISFDSDTGEANENSFAWGSNVIGWVDFSQVKIMPIVSTPVVILRADRTIIAPGDGTYLTWSGNDKVKEGSESCKTTEGNTGDSWKPNKPYPMTALFSTGILQNDTTYTIKCLGVDGTTYSPESSVTIIVDAEKAEEIYGHGDPNDPNNPNGNRYYGSGGKNGTGTQPSIIEN